MEFDKILRIMTNILLVIIVILFIYITPIALEDKELYKECNEKVLCENGLISGTICLKYNRLYNYTFNISLPND